MAVTVRLFAAARAAAGTSEISVPAGTLAQVLDAAERAYPGLARVRPSCSVLVDELAAHDDADLIADDSVVDLLPPFAGG